MANDDKLPVFDLANPSRKFLIAVGGLAFFVLFLIALSAALSVKFIAPSFQIVAIVLLLSLPMSGLSFGVWFILRNLQKFARDSAGGVWQLMSFEEQKRKFVTKIEKLSANSDLRKEEISKLKSDYLLAENLALRQIERERKTPVTRNICVAETNFDAGFVSRNGFTFAEIVFLTTPNFSPQDADSLLNKMQATKKRFARLNLNSKIRLLLVFVTRLDETAEARLRHLLSESFNSTPVDVDVRLLDFETLLRDFTEQ